MEDLELRAQGMMRRYVTSGDRDAWVTLMETVNVLAVGGDFAAALGIFENAIQASPRDPLLHYNAARVCEAWGDALAGDYFGKTPGHSLSPWEWMFGEGTPYPRFKELRQRTVAYYQTALELHPDLDTEVREAIEEKIFWFGWA